MFAVDEAETLNLCMVGFKLVLRINRDYDKILFPADICTAAHGLDINFSAISVDSSLLDDSFLPKTCVTINAYFCCVLWCL